MPHRMHHHAPHQPQPAPMDAVACLGCGAPLPDADASGRHTCRHCGYHNVLTAEQQARLRHYVHQVASHEMAADHERREREKLELPLQLMKKTAPTTVAILFLGPPVLSYFGLGHLSLPLVIVAFIGSAATIVVGYRDLVTSNAAGRQGGVVAVDCPQCGATNRKARGMPLQHCAYCGASLVASAPVVHHAIEESKLDRMGEMMRRLRVTRSTTDSDSYNRGFYSALIFPGSIFLMFGLVIFGGGTINGERPHPILAPAVYTAALAIVLLPLVRFELRIQALRRGLTELSRSVFRGQPFHHPRFFAAWLNRHWCADQPSLSRSSVGLYGGVGGEVDGYPVAVELASGRLSVLVAAYLPDADPVHPHIDASWRQAGFGASWYATGLWLSSTSPHWKRDPGQVGELASIVRRAVDQVQRRGGRPLHFP